MNLGDTIKKLRHRKGIKQKTFAERCDLSPTYLSQIEHNQKEPNISTLKIIAEHLDISVPILFFLSVDEDDIIPEKRAAYKILEPSIKSMISELFVLKEL